MKKTYSGLSNKKKVNQLLKKRDYLEVLNHLWSEHDRSARVIWLEKKVNEGHPILMFELAKEYYDQNPKLETYLFETMPWMLAGVKRTFMDVNCTSDKSVSAAVQFLLFVYQESILADLQKTDSLEEIQCSINENYEQFSHANLLILKKVMEPFVNGNHGSQPSPTWVFNHGMGQFLKESNTISAAKWEQIRKKEAEEFLRQAEKALLKN